MLYFQTKADRVFLDLLHDAIDLLIEDVEMEEAHDQVESFAADMPRSSRFFTPQEAKEQLRALQHASRATELYQPTDYHWLLLYETLQLYCALFSDGPFGVLKEKYGIEEIEFDAVVDLFFWDTDFLDDHLGDLPMETRQQLDVSPETFGLSLGMKPHPEELALKVCHPNDESESSEVFTPESKKYPSF